MGTLSVTIPDAQDQRVLDGCAGQLGYQATINGEPNPETKVQFVRRKLREFVKDLVRAYEASQAAESARQTAISNVDSQITLT